jgi:hypothetical protein
MHAFGIWLDTPAGGEWFYALLMLGCFLVVILKGARRG